jgi:hypothetical protein
LLQAVTAETDRLQDVLEDLEAETFQLRAERDAARAFRALSPSA